MKVNNAFTFYILSFSYLWTYRHHGVSVMKIRMRKRKSCCETQKRQQTKKTACYSQALELDVELLHLHLVPWLQLGGLKKKKKKSQSPLQCSNCIMKERKWLVTVTQHVAETVKWPRRSLYTSFTPTCQSILKLTLWHWGKLIFRLLFLLVRVHHKEQLWIRWSTRFYAR